MIPGYRSRARRKTGAANENAGTRAGQFGLRVTFRPLRKDLVEGFQGLLRTSLLVLVTQIIAAIVAVGAIGYLAFAIARQERF